MCGHGDESGSARTGSAASGRGNVERGPRPADKRAHSTGPSTLAATSVSLQATVTLQPSVSASPDVIEGFLVSLFNMSFQLTVGYGG